MDSKKKNLNIRNRKIVDFLITGGILALCFVLSLVVERIFKTESLIPCIFILGSFLTSVITDGYIYAGISVLFGVLLVNYAFAFPQFGFNFTIQENLVSAIIMAIVATVTCTLTTKIKHQEALKAEGEKERMRANLLRAVSHDLRTPLTTIYGSSSAILENFHDFTEDQKIKMLSGISQDAQWLIRMVENLLSITKLDSGNVKLIKTETALDELIDSVLVKFAKRYPNQEVEVDLPDEMILIPMDALLIEQVLVNLLENAVQHAVGMTELELKVFSISQKVIFEIRDNGCGIEEERLKHLFTGFFEPSSTPSDGKVGNAGIGLAVCASIIRAHNGEIKAENLKHGGSIFRFTLDRGDAEDE